MANLGSRSKTRSIDAEIRNWQSEAEVLPSRLRSRATSFGSWAHLRGKNCSMPNIRQSRSSGDIQRVTELRNTSQHDERSLGWARKDQVTAPFSTASLPTATCAKARTSSRVNASFGSLRRRLCSCASPCRKECLAAFATGRSSKSHRRTCPEKSTSPASAKLAPSSTRPAAPSIAVELVGDRRFAP